MSTRVVRGGELTPEQRRVHRVEHILRRDGGSPGSALEGLASIIEDGTWRKVPRDAEDLRPFETFRQFVEARRPFGLQYSIRQLEALLQLAHPREENHPDMRKRMDAMRAKVRKLLKKEIQPALPQGGDRRSDEFQGSTATLKADSGGKDRGSDYRLARLKRDRPDLAERVIAGEVSVYAAAREAGIRKPTVTITSPESIARSLRRHLGPDDIAALIRHLLGDAS